MSTQNDNTELNADLLGYHLGLIDDAERARLEAAFESPEALASALERLQRVLAPLEADEAPTPPADLVQGILDRVEEAKNTLPFKPSVAASVTEAGRDVGSNVRMSRPLMRFRELVGLAAAILLFVGIFVPGYRGAQNAAERTACMTNLQQIGQGYAGYGEANDGQWPYAGAVPVGTPWLQRDAAGVQRGANSRHTFALVRGRFVPARAFCDPARQSDVPLALSDPTRLSDFPDPRNNSYVTQFVTRPWRQSELTSEMPIAADMTPLVDQQRRIVPIGRMTLNSNTHGPSKGQNVLRADLTVTYHVRPNVGVQRDDIYRLIGVAEYTGLERPSQRSDAFLIP